MLRRLASITSMRRYLSTESEVKQAEQKVVSKLKKTFKNASKLEAEDISGGCGAMYRVVVETPEFKGKLKIQQHKMVTDVLKDDIKKWHGIVIETKA